MTRDAPAKRGSKAGKAPTQRQLRVSEEIRHVLSAIFGRGEFRDPDLAAAQITVTEVRISPDLKNATAFVARLAAAPVDATPAEACRYAVGPTPDRRDDVAVIAVRFD